MLQSVAMMLFVIGASSRRDRRLVAALVLGGVLALVLSGGLHALAEVYLSLMDWVAAGDMPAA